MKKLLLSILALYLLAEEWLWDILTALGQRLSRWLGLVVLERWLAQASPGAALAALLLPAVLILPVKLAALFLFTHGQIIQGIVLLISAKLFATLLVSRLFAVAKPQLMTFAWFAFLYSTITRWLNWAHERIRATLVYQQAVKLRQAVKARLAQWLKTG